MSDICFRAKIMTIALQRMRLFLIYIKVLMVADELGAYT
jgi:hypothetical protein